VARPQPSDSFEASIGDIPALRRFTAPATEKAMFNYSIVGLRSAHPYVLNRSARTIDILPRSIDPYASDYRYFMGVHTWRRLGPSLRNTGLFYDLSLPVNRLLRVTDNLHYENLSESRARTYLNIIARRAPYDWVPFPFEPYSAERYRVGDIFLNKDGMRRYDKKRVRFSEGYIPLNVRPLLAWHRGVISLDHNVATKAVQVFVPRVETEINFGKLPRR